MNFNNDPIEFTMDGKHFVHFNGNLNIFKLESPFDITTHTYPPKTIKAVAEYYLTNKRIYYKKSDHYLTEDLEPA